MFLYYGFLVGGFRLTSSGEMLQTEMPLTSSIWSPVWTEDSRSGLRTAGSNLRHSKNERFSRGKGEFRQKRRERVFYLEVGGSSV